jgi:hypothetical protein
MLGETACKANMASWQTDYRDMNKWLNFAISRQSASKARLG